MSTASFLVQEPHQERSRRTMTRIMDAAARILEMKTFEQLTIAEVVRAAGTSVGAFYGRFKDKYGLLQALDERFFKEFELAVHALLRPSIPEALPVSFIIEEVTRMLVMIYGSNRGVLRSLNLAARLHGDPRFRQREQRAWGELFPDLQAILLAHGDEIGHPEPLLATRFGFQQLFFAMRELLLWEPLREGVPYEDDVVIAELTRAYLAYLRVGDVA